MGDRHDSVPADVHGQSFGLMVRLTVPTRFATALVALVLVAGCGTTARAHHQILTSGVWNTNRWSLTLSPGGGGMWCLSVTGTKRDSGQCGFDDPGDPTAGRSAQAGLDDTHDLDYGPAPTGTITVRLTSPGIPAMTAAPPPGASSAEHPAVPSAGPPAITTAHRLPTWAPPGTWWTAIVPTGYWQPHFYDAAGRELTPTRF